MQGKKIIAVSAVSIRKGGTLTILRQCLRYLSSVTDRYDVVAFVHRQELCDFPGIRYVEMPGCAGHWGKRLYAEYVSMYRISRRLSPDGVFLWLSMHDATPRVVARHRAVYCHTSFPFMKPRMRDLMMDVKLPLFTLFTRYIYRLNVMHNDWLIVQQQWFRESLSAMTGFPGPRIILAPPPVPVPETINRTDNGTVTFLYPSTPDCHKNFETLCEAARLLEQRVGQGAFKVILTVDGTENRYSRWLKRRWGKVGSIIFGGLIPQKELFCMYAEASCLVFPSRTESWGLPVSEFKAFDKPMIIADMPYAYEAAAGAGKVALFDLSRPSVLADIMHSVVIGYPALFHPVPDTKPSAPVAYDWKQLFEKYLLNHNL